MTKEDRQNAILEELMTRESILVSDLADLLDVSSVTIRKDLTELESDGKLYRSHGKAIAINPFTSNRSVNEKEKLSPEEKSLIGMEAAKLIEENDSIILASGTTIQYFARFIQPIHHLTVVSASLQVSLGLSNNENIEIIQLGGALRHSSKSVVGFYSEQFLDSCYASKLFLGVDGIDFDFGITTTDMREAYLNQRMMKTAQKTIVLADATKFGKKGFAKISNLEDVDVIITDERIKPTEAALIEELGIKLIIAKKKDTELT